MSDCVMKCANCAFYRLEDGEDWGICRRYPPVMILTAEGPTFDFPSVEGEEYCGEYTRGHN